MFSRESKSSGTFNNLAGLVTPYVQTPKPSNTYQRVWRNLLFTLAIPYIISPLGVNSFSVLAHFCNAWEVFSAMPVPHHCYWQLFCTNWAVLRAVWLVVTQPVLCTDDPVLSLSLCKSTKVMCAINIYWTVLHTQMHKEGIFISFFFCFYLVNLLIFVCACTCLC